MIRPPRLIVPPTAEPIHLDAAKLHLRVDHSTEDALIRNWIRSAMHHAELVTRRVLVASTWELTLDRWPDDDRIDPPGRIDLGAPLRGITSITYTDTDGVDQVLSSSDYQVDTVAEPGCVWPAYGDTWPDLRSDRATVTIQYTAGHLVPFTADDTGDTITTSGHSFSDGDRLRLSNSGGADGALPDPLAELTDYYVVSASGSTCQLALTAGGAAIDLTDTGTGSHFATEASIMLPPDILPAMLLLIGSAYEHREGEPSKADDIANNLLAGAAVGIGAP